MVRLGSKRFCREGLKNLDILTVPCFYVYRILRTIRRTLIFKQFFKKITFLPFLLLDCKTRLKKKNS
jgi:hypothetical protein